MAFFVLVLEVEYVRLVLQGTSKAPSEKNHDKNFDNSLSQAMNKPYHDAWREA